MVSVVRRFLRSYASDILVGFLVGWFTLSFLGPAIAQAGNNIPQNSTNSKHLILQTSADGLPAASGVAPKKMFHVQVTAYTSLPDETDSTPFITANGSHVQDGIIAANFLPFGTKVRIPQVFGNRIFTVEDRMNKRYPDGVDVWMNNYQAARNLGRRNLTIEVF